MILWGILLLIAISIVWGTFRLGISPMPSSGKYLKVLKSHLPTSITGEVYELGSGWGSVLTVLFKKYPQVPVIGIEGSAVPFLVSRLRFFGRLKNKHKIVYHNFYEKSFHNANLIYCYLYPGAMKKLSKKFKDELPKGAMIISAVFSLPGWKAVQVFEVKDLYRSKIYIYIA